MNSTYRYVVFDHLLVLANGLSQWNRVRLINNQHLTILVALNWIGGAFLYNGLHNEAYGILAGKLFQKCKVCCMVEYSIVKAKGIAGPHEIALWRVKSHDAIAKVHRPSHWLSVRIGDIHSNWHIAQNWFTVDDILGRQQLNAKKRQHIFRDVKLDALVKTLL